MKDRWEVIDPDRFQNEIQCKKPFTQRSIEIWKSYSGASTLNTVYNCLKPLVNTSGSPKFLIFVPGSTQFYNPLTMRMLSNTPPTSMACAPPSIQAQPASLQQSLQQNRMWDREPAPLLSAQYETLSDSDDWAAGKASGNTPWRQGGKRCDQAWGWESKGDDRTQIEPNGSSSAQTWGRSEASGKNCYRKWM